MFTPLRDGSLSVEVPESIHIETVHGEAAHNFMSVQASGSVQDLRNSNKIHYVNIVENEPGSVEGLSAHDYLSVQGDGSTGDSLSFRNSEYVQYPLSDYPLPVQTFQIPRPMQEDEEINTSHMFPQLSLAAMTESASSASVLTSQLPRVSPLRPSHGDPFARLEEGQIFESSVTSEPIRLGSIDVKKMTTAAVLFTFGILGVIADLRPCFTYKYGPDGKIGVRLQIYGHTVVIQPVSEDANAVRIIACRHGLEKLRKFHSSWILPPQPIDGPSGPEWSWVQIVQGECCFTSQPSISPKGRRLATWKTYNHAKFQPDYCRAQGFPSPQYVECRLETQYFCDVIVKDRVFRSARQCVSLGEAQNTVAHIAMHQLLIAEVDLSPGSILSPDPPKHASNRDLLPGLKPIVPQSDVKPFTLPVENDNLPRSLEQDFANSLEDDLQHLMMNCPNENRHPRAQTKAPGPLAPVQLRRATKRGVRRRGGKKKKPPQKAKQEPNPPLQQAKTNRLVTKQPSNPQRPNSNLIPLLNNRISHLAEEEEKVEDKLSLLKEVETALRELHATASYWRLLERFCHVLKIGIPAINQFPNLEDSPRFPHVIRASFDSKNPYLSRASPIWLADIPLMSHNEAHALGVQKVIVYLLQFLREDADISPCSDEYRDELPFLRSLEMEIEDRFQR